MPNYDTVIDLAETITILKQEIGKRDEWIQQRDRKVEMLEQELERVISGEAHDHKT